MDVYSFVNDMHICISVTELILYYYFMSIVTKFEVNLVGKQIIFYF